MCKVDEAMLLYYKLQDKQIEKSLIGISGFILRKKILEYLKEENLIESDEYIYQYSNHIIEEALDELFVKRKEFMEKDVKPYKQHGPTCAICSLLMTLDYYDKIDKPNRLMESHLYKKYKSNYIDGAHYSGIANQLLKQKLDVTLVHSEKNYFSNQKGYISDCFDELMNEYTSYLKNDKLNVKCNVDLNEKTLRKGLENQNLILLAGMSGNFLHSIVICGYENDNFIICDPQSKEKEKLSNDTVKKFMNTPIGKWCIMVNDSTLESKNFIKLCDKFYEKAENFLKQKKEKENE